MGLPPRILSSEQDCVEFLRAVGLSLGLDMPQRGITHWTPHAYVRALLASVAEVPD